MKAERGKGGQGVCKRVKITMDIESKLYKEENENPRGQRDHTLQFST